MNKQQLLTTLELEDPFKTFRPKPDPTFFGWNGDTPIFGNLINEIKPKLVVEVGSWMGQSSINMASNIKAQGLSNDSCLLCFDTWLGSKEHWADKNLRKHLHLRNGYPTFFEDFMTNVLNNDVEDVLMPIPLTSVSGAELLKEYGIKADLIYVDGSHEFRDVYNDLEAFWQVLSPGAILFGDDWDWSGVRGAVLAFCAEIGCPVAPQGINWILRKRF
ncbi:class I SAM-dependent methyltransferase [Patescibacteria group bacterium]|nr:MAG: class I SAM-dependent methyltransferase [Patescibacteria group bacterium]